MSGGGGTKPIFGDNKSGRRHTAAEAALNNGSKSGGSDGGGGGGGGSGQQLWTVAADSGCRQRQWLQKKTITVGRRGGSAANGQWAGGNREGTDDERPLLCNLWHL